MALDYGAIEEIQHHQVCKIVALWGAAAVWTRSTVSAKTEEEEAIDMNQQRPPIGEET